MIELTAEDGKDRGIPNPHKPRNGEEYNVLDGTSGDRIVDVVPKEPEA